VGDEVLREVARRLQQNVAPPTPLRALGTVPAIARDRSAERAPCAEQLAATVCKAFTVLASASIARGPA
jgi:GGDEF domain-containing protein